MTEIIKVKHVYKDYILSDNVVQNVLKDIDCVVHDGDFVSIMGPSGSGKSTLMNILGCLDQPTTGEYYLNGKNVARLSKRELANVRNKYLGFVFQGFNLLSRRTIFDNVAMPMVYASKSSGEIKESVQKILTSVKLENYMHYFPNQLSGGMQQRVAIARALINNPKVIFADEPTGNLDTKTSQEIMEIFQNLNNYFGISIVMVTHEPDIAKYSKRLIYIKDGIKQYDCMIKQAVELGLV